MKVGIVGGGLVGSTAAYAMVMRGVGNEIVIIDKNPARASAEADDIFHAVPFAYPVNVTAGGYADLRGCRAVVITAGVGQKPGESRLQLLGRNAAVFAEVIPHVAAYAPDAVLVIATNPVDIMTHIAARYAANAGIPAHRVVGSGTTLDTARFRVLLGRRFDIDSRHVHGYVVGEHGDSEVLTWSRVTVGCMPIQDFCALRNITLDISTKEYIDTQVRRAAYNIIGGKGATYYGIGSALARIVEVILFNRRSVLTVCSPVADVAGVRDVTVSLPNILGNEGIIETLPLPLDEAEQTLLRKSALLIRNSIDELDTKEA